RTLLTSTLGAVATASLALAIVELLEVRPLAVILLVIPVSACVAAFRGYMKQREQREHVEFLYESMRATQGAPEFGLAVGQLLVAARRLLRAEYAEILLLPPTDEGGPLRSVSGAEGELLMHPEERFSSADAAALAEVASIGSATLLTRRRATHAFDAFLHSRGLEDAIVAPLRGEDRTFGLLVVGERLGDVSTFDEADVELLVTFAGPLAGPIRVQDLAARLGGDEFAVLVRDADAPTAVSVARRMLDSIDGTYTLGCGDVACHVSVGIAVGAAGITSGEDLIRNADI